MKIEQVNEIKQLIKKCEIESAKSQGIIELIKKEWLDKFSTDDIEQIKIKLAELNEELEQDNNRINKLYDKLINVCDWESLKKELN